MTDGFSKSRSGAESQQAFRPRPPAAGRGVLAILKKAYFDWLVIALRVRVLPVPCAPDHPLHRFEAYNVVPLTTTPSLKIELGSCPRAVLEWIPVLLVSFVAIPFPCVLACWIRALLDFIAGVVLVSGLHEQAVRSRVRQAPIVAVAVGSDSASRIARCSWEAPVSLNRWCLLQR